MNSVNSAILDHQDRQRLHVQLVNNFTLEPACRAKLKSYYILHWETDYLVQKLTANAIIRHADVDYVPIFQGTLFGSRVVKLSFREPHLDTGIPAYVLIQPNHSIK